MKRPVPIYEPLYTLKPIAENIWIVDGDLIEMDAVLTKLPFSTRMTVIKLANGQLWCHSPIQPNQALFDQLDALGPVAHLVSPNKIHYAYIADWKKLILRRLLGLAQEWKREQSSRKSRSLLMKS